MKYLITGGAGFIGSNIAQEILKRGNRIKIIDDLSTGFKRNIESLIEDYPKKIKFIKGSITNPNLLQKEMKNIDCVIHLAAFTSVPRSIEEPLQANKININGFLNVLVAARDNQVKRVVFSSSAAVYGNSSDLPKMESIIPMPLSPYAVGKITGEYYMKVFYKLYGLETVCLRFFNIFGPKQNPHSQYASAIPKFIKAIVNNQSPIIFGDGKQTRDFTYIQNVVNATLLGCKEKNAAGEVINVGYGKEVSVLELVETINKVLNKNIKPKFTDPRPGDIRHSYADITKAKKILDYYPKINYKQGLKRTIKWYYEKFR